MRLSKRLQTIADLVGYAKSVVDVGCDHGHIPIWLIEEKRIEHAIASDIGAGPLARAAENIRAHGLEGRIETRRSDGLAGICAGEGETLIIAGMGGRLMIRILSEGGNVARSFNRLVLEPQSDLYEVRVFLYASGFSIVSERMVEEDGKFYPVLAAEPVKGTLEAPCRLALLFGPCLLEEADPALIRFLQKQRRMQRDLLHTLFRADSPRLNERRLEVKQSLEETEAALALIEGRTGQRP